MYNKNLFLFLITLGLLAAQPLKRVTVPASYGVTCNDGSPYVFYIRQNSQTLDKWFLFLQGGAWCFDLYSCTERWNDAPRLMSSKNYSSEMGGGYGILSPDPAENPLFWNWNTVFFPYCTSDDFSGNSEENNTPWSFLGSRVVPSVIAYLQSMHNVYGLKDGPSTTVVLSGSSAGGEGILPNIQSLQKVWLPKSKVLGLDDSGWFLDSPPYYSKNCRDAGSCTEQEGLQKGVKLWNPVVNHACAKAYPDLWQCVMAYYTKPFITVPMFVFQYRFDSAQMGHDGIYQNPDKSPSTLKYAQISAANLTNTMYTTDQQAYFLPSCYYHTILNNPKWLNLTISGVSLPSAISQFLQGQNLKLVDSCNTPDCNPTCP